MTPEGRQNRNQRVGKIENRYATKIELATLGLFVLGSAVSKEKQVTDRADQSRRTVVQTLKTAAIVVLVMAVLYGSYVSLTTPPEPLPAEIENMLVETGELDIEAGFPESLDIFAIDEGAAAEGTSGNDSFAANPPSPSSSPGGSPVGFSIGDNGTSAMDLGSPLPSSVSSISIDSGSPMATGSPMALPPVNASLSANTPKADPTRDYPRTGSEFALPNPDLAAAVFDAVTGSDAGSNALASPTTASFSDHSLDVKPAGLSLPRTESASVGPNAVDGGASSAAAKNAGLINAIQTADKQYKADQRKEALATLSLFYSTPNLSPSDREQLLARLDPLAGEVIYSRRHLLEQPHRIGHNETLMEIASRVNVPWQLLANINGITDPVTVLPGTELKVVRGPFRAEVDLASSELTLFLGDLYAGRFPIAVGSDPVPTPGTYTVQDKQTSRTFYDAAGSPVPAGSPNNPYGNVWMDLGGQLSIHGSPERTRPTSKGCVSLAGDYAEDLYGILSQGSSVTIRR